MAKRRSRKSSVPLLLFWSKRDQVRFIDAVERLCSLVNDLSTLVTAAKRRRRGPAAPPENGQSGEGR